MIVAILVLHRMMEPQESIQFNLSKPKCDSPVISAVASAANATNADAERMLQAFVAVTRTALAEGKKVYLPDLGGFATKERAARKARNPSTGAPIDVPAKTVVTFKVAGSLADHVK